MIGVVDRIRTTVVSTKEYILQELARIQKPILDRKIDELLKDASRVRRITVKYVGRGLGIGKRVGSAVRKGRSLVKRLAKLQL